MTAHTFHSMRDRGKKDHADALRHHTGGKVSEPVKSEIRKAISEHDSQMHSGKHTHLKLKAGGMVEGHTAPKRLDRASGGRTNKSKHAPSVHINIVSASPRPAAPGAMGAPPPMAPHPMGPPPGAGMPPGGAPGMPPGAGAMPPRPPMAGPPISQGTPGMMRAKGGRVSYPIEDGAGGGSARLQKMDSYGKAKPRGENADETSELEDKPAGSGKSPMRKGGRAK